MSPRNAQRWLLALLISSSTMAWCNFADRFQAARQMMEKGNHAEAAAAFQEVAKEAPTPRSKSQALGFAAESLLKAEQPEAAYDLAATIPLEPYARLTRLELRAAQRQWAELIEEFKDEPLATWPEACIDLGYMLRGEAYLHAGQLEAGISDLKQAAETAAGDETLQARAYLQLGRAYQSADQPDKALAAWADAQQAFPSNRIYMYLTATLSRAAVLREQGRFAEAKQELEKLDHGSMTGGHWHFRVLRAYGQLAEAQGRQQEALDWYQQALAIETGHPADLASLRQYLETFTTSSEGDTP